MAANACAEGRARPPWDDAVALWHMADEEDAVGQCRLVTHGRMKLGARMNDADRAASLSRGGDGKAAEFEGGYLALADDAVLKIIREQFTIAIRMRDTEGTWLYPILGSYGSDKEVSIALRAVDGAKMPFTDRHIRGHEVPTIYAWMFRPGGPRSVPGCSSILELVWGAQEPNAARVNGLRTLQQPELHWPNPLQQDVLNAVMKPCFPVGLIGPREWHDIVVCLTGPKLQLWIDGVLVDEEFPIGVTRKRALPFLIGAGNESGQLKTGFKGLIDHVAIWNRPLAPNEIATLSGGARHVRRRELAILGDESPTMQYFRPRGHNRKAGDLTPYWDAQADTLRLFYEIVRRNHHSKWDGTHGAIEIWQASTKDLKTWQHHPVTIPITEQWEAWTGTGGVAYHQGTYHYFYPTPDHEGDHGGIQHAVSEDGVHFVKQGPHPFVEGRDCEIFQTDDGLFHMIKGGPTQPPRTRPVGDKTPDTCVNELKTQVRFTSDDLIHWTEVEEPFIASETGLDIDICPHVFHFGGWYYYMCGAPRHQSGVWRSRGPFGPWAEHRPQRLDNLGVPKTAAFGKSRRIYAGFLSDGGWGGNSVLRELVQDADGWLGTRFVPELVPRCGEALPISFTPGAARANPDSAEIRLEPKAGKQSAMIPDVTGDYRLQMEILPEADVRSFGIGLRATSGGKDSGCDLIFDPAARRVSFTKMSDSGGGVHDGPSIDDVRGLDKPFTVDLIARHDIIDVEIAAFRSLTTRFWNPSGRCIRLFAEGGVVTFRNVRAWHLAEPYAPYPDWPRGIATSTEMP